MKLINCLIILVLCVACKGSSGSKAQTPVVNNPPVEEEEKVPTYISTYKSGIFTGPCRSCLIVEINEYSLNAVFTEANPAVEDCRDSAKYTSEFNNSLSLPTGLGQQVVWNLSKIQGGSEPNCFPDSLDLYITKESSSVYNFLFSHNTNEYTMVENF